MTESRETRSPLPDIPPEWADLESNWPAQPARPTWSSVWRPLAISAWRPLAISSAANPAPLSLRGAFIICAFVLAAMALEVFFKGWIVIAELVFDMLVFLLLWGLWQAWKHRHS